MKKITPVLVLVFILGCSRQTREVSLLHEVFLSIADTSIYEYHHYLPAPQEARLPVKDYGKYLLCVCDSLHPPIRYAAELKSALKENALPSALIEIHGKEKAQSVQPLLKQDMFDRFKVIPESNCDPNNTDYAGTLKFYLPLIHKGKALLVSEKKYKQKAGVVTLSIYEQINGEWIEIRRNEIERW